MKNFSLVILLVAIVMSFSSVFVVPEGQKAIVLLFSKVQKDDDDQAVVYGHKQPLDHRHLFVLY